MHAQVVRAVDEHVEHSPLVPCHRRSRRPSDALNRPAHQNRESSSVANIKSQIKRNKHNAKAHERNKAVKTG